MPKSGSRVRRVAQGTSLLMATVGLLSLSCSDDAPSDVRDTGGSSAAGKSPGGASSGGASSGGMPASGASAGGTTGQGGKTAAGTDQGARGGQETGGASNASGADAGGQGAEAGSTGGSAGGAANPSGGCNKPSPGWAAGNRDITVGGTKRSYFFVPPKNYSAATPYPVIVGFHGGGGNGENGHDYFALEEATGGQALLAFPSGNQGDGGWALQNQGTDMLLFDAILSELEQAYCVDRDHIFATGFSYGGWMATQVACARPDVVRAISSIAGGGPMGQCSTAVAAMIIHGTADSAEPIAAGEKSRDHFRSTNGCGTGTAAAQPSPCVAYDGCKAGKSLLWCPHPGDHGIPDFARDGMWRFFTSLP